MKEREKTLESEMKSMLRNDIEVNGYSLGRSVFSARLDSLIGNVTEEVRIENNRGRKEHLYPNRQN